MIVNCQLQFKGFNNHNYYIIIIHYFEKKNRITDKKTI